jgi:hypothetical protein
MKHFSQALLVPQSAGFGQPRQFGAVAGLRGLLPGCDSAVVFNLLQSAEHGLVGEIVELLATQIIAAAFHVANAQLALAIGKKRLLQKRNIFVK